MSKSRDLLIFEEASKGNLAEVKALYNDGADINMALMGATWQEENLSKEQKEIGNYAIMCGASPLFALPRETLKKMTESPWLYFHYKQAHIGPNEIERERFKGGRKGW